MNSEDKWLKQIKDKVEGHREEAPAALWSKIAADLPLSQRQTKTIPLYRKSKFWLAAAVLFLGVSSIALLWQEEGVKLQEAPQKVYVAHDPYLNSIVEELQEEELLPSAQADIAEALTSGVSSTPESGIKPSLLASHTKIESQSAVRTFVSNIVTPQEDQLADEQSVEVLQEQKTGSSEKSDRSQARSAKKYDDLYAHLRAANPTSGDVDQTAQSRLSLHAGGAGKILGGGVSGVQTNSFYREVSLDSFVSPATLDSQKKTEMFIRDGLPYIKDEIQINDYKHNQPISFGLSYSYGLNKYLALESGLVYTYLSSDVTEIATQERFKQKFHYLGIPIKLYWSFFKHNKLSLYASGGGMVEVAVAGKVGGENKRPTRPQFSVLAGVGAQYSFSSVFGLYIEPGVAYYFNDGSHIETIRTEKPFNFNLNAGVRLTF